VTGDVSMAEITVTMVLLLWWVLGYIEDSAGRRPIGKYAWLARCIAAVIFAVMMIVFGYIDFISKPSDWLSFSFCCLACLYCVGSAIIDFRRHRQIERLLAEGKIDKAITGG